MKRVLRWAAGPALAAALLGAAALCGAVAPDGYLVKVDHGTVYLDWGKASGIQPGDTFSIYRPGPVLRHPVTGEVLGHEQVSVGAGYVDSVEEKFSVGHLTDRHGNPQAGDRTHEIEAASLPEREKLEAPSTPEASTSVPRETWRSAPIPEEAVGLTLADLRGDGQKEIVVAYRRAIEVFQWNGAQLASVARFENARYSHWLSVEAADPGHSGRDRIFATAFLDGIHRARVAVLELSGQALTETTHLDGFIRAINGPDGNPELVWQSLSLSRELYVSQPTEVEPYKNGYKPGKELHIQRLNNDQLFGFTFGAWADAGPDLALLQGGDHLRIFMTGAKWSASEAYGGTKDDFLVHDDQIASVFPRLWSLKRLGAKDAILVPHNIPELGIRTTYLKLFKRAELSCLEWNGLEMAPRWKIPVAGYLSDFAVDDRPREAAPQLWLATVGPGGKTVFIVYRLPV